MNPKNRFQYHTPTPEHVDLIQRVRQACEDLDDLLLFIPMHPRYKALARTRLEEVSMHANKGIVFVNETD